MKVSFDSLSLCVDGFVKLVTQYFYGSKIFKFNLLFDNIITLRSCLFLKGLKQNI